MARTPRTRALLDPAWLHSATGTTTGFLILYKSGRAYFWARPGYACLPLRVANAGGGQCVVKAGDVRLDMSLQA